MNKFNDTMKEISTNVQLTEHEKSTMRTRVHEYMAHTPIRPELPPRKSTTYALRYRFSTAFVIIAIVFTSGVGISYASVDALPGDTLYPVKEVREEVTERFIRDDTKRVEYAIERAHRRLQEVEALAARGRLDAETEVLVQAKFEKFSQRADARIARLEQHNPERAHALRIALTVGIEARAETLATRAARIHERENDARTRIAHTIAMHTHDVESSKPAAAPRIAVHKAVVNTEETMMMADTASTEVVAEITSPAMVPPVSITVLMQRLVAQKERLEKLHERTNDISIQKELDTILEYIDETQNDIQTHVRAAEYAQAERLVREALRTVHKARATLEVHREAGETPVLKNIIKKERVQKPQSLQKDTAELPQQKHLPTDQLERKPVRE